MCSICWNQVHWKHWKRSLNWLIPSLMYVFCDFWNTHTNLFIVIYFWWLLKILPPNTNTPVHSFDGFNKSLSAIGLSEHMREKVNRHLAGILYLGNVRFQDDKQGYAEISEIRSLQCVECAAKLFGIDCKKLQNVLLQRKFANDDIMYVSKKLYIMLIETSFIWYIILHITA